MNDDPIAFFFTWVTCGTWLPGDERGWVEYRHGFQLPNSDKEWMAALRMTEDACYLDHNQQEIVERQIAETCRVRGWTLHVANCRTNHFHAVITAQEVKPEEMRDQLKAWCTRRLNEHQLVRQVASNEQRTKWWAERGSVRWVWSMESLTQAADYAGEQQDNRRRFLDE